MRIMILLLVLSLFGCVTYDSRYMGSDTTCERLQDVIILMGFGAAVGISIYKEVR